MKYLVSLLLALPLLAAAQAPTAEVLAAAQAPTAEVLDALQHRGLDHPRAALQTLRDLPAPPPALAAQRDYVEQQLRLRSSESGELQFGALHADSPSAWLLRALAARLQGRGEEGLAMSRRALEALRPACPLPGGLPPDSPAPNCELRLAFDAALQTARGLREQDELPQALELAQSAQRMARQIGDARRESQALMEEVQLQLLRGELAPARQRITEALSLVQGQPVASAQVLMVESQVARAGGALAQQRRLLEQALALARQHDAPVLAVVLQGNLADHFLLAGEPARAREVAEAALKQMQARGEEMRYELHMRHNLSVALVRLREFDAARAQLAQLAQLAKASQLPVRDRAEQLRELGQAWAASAQWRDALAAYHAERELTAQANEREREASLTALRRENEQAEQKAGMVAAREERALNARTLENQRRQRLVIVLAAVLLGLGLAVGLLLWVGSQAAHRRLRRSQARLQDLAERDALTGLANRRAFQLAMQARGEEPLQGSLLMLDIDHFKRINDTHGHAAGDAVLQAVAQRLRAQVRASDLLVRWGGEEFLLYCPGMPAPTLRNLAQRLLRALESSPVAVEGELTLSVSASIGFAAWPLPPQHQEFGWEQAVNWVDLALYQAKQAGRARAVGIVAANVSGDEAIARVEADFAGAASAARIELLTLRAAD